MEFSQLEHGYVGKDPMAVLWETVQIRRMLYIRAKLGRILQLQKTGT